MLSTESQLHELICTRDFSDKIRLARALTQISVSALHPLPSAQLESLKLPGRPEHFQVVPPRQVPMRRKLHQPQRRVNFLHAIANIELLAIELPLLSLLRFGSNDANFIHTQLHIAAEEAEHFELLRDRLRAMNCEFGTLPVHNSLWECAWKCESELEHQIVIPCFLEARGLDVTPQFISAFRELGDDDTAGVLEIILRDEIEHVRHGMDYFRAQQKKLGTAANALFESILQKHFKDRYRSKVPLNESARLQAGFSNLELGVLANLKV